MAARNLEHTVVVPDVYYSYARDCPRASFFALNDLPGSASERAARRGLFEGPLDSGTKIPVPKEAVSRDRVENG